MASDGLVRTLPPPAHGGAPAWLRRNLFSSPLNTALTFIVAWLLYVALPPVVEWAVTEADWRGETREACTGAGACWVFIKARFCQVLYGFYPEA